MVRASSIVLVYEFREDYEGITYEQMGKMLRKQVRKSLNSMSIPATSLNALKATVCLQSIINALVVREWVVIIFWSVSWIL